MKYSKIGIYDSGIGGVSILKELVKILKADYIYLSDSKNNPYGDKDIELVKNIISKNIEFLIDKGCDIIVVACNTATSIMIDELRNNYPNVIFIGTEPAVKVVYDMNIDDKVLLLATKITLESDRVHRLIDKYKINNLETYKASGLAELIENKDEIGIDEYFNSHLTNYKNHKYIILGCTHYPLIKEKFQEFFSESTIVDGSIGVSEQVKRKVEEYNLIFNSNNIEFIDTSSDNHKLEIFNYYLS